VAAGPYRTLLAAPGALPLVLAAFVGRLPIGMGGLAILLLVEESTGSYATAGIVTALTAVAEAVGGPVQGRLIDRFGQTPSLLATALAFPAALVGLVLAADARAAPALLCGLGALVGLALPPIMAAMRTLWARLVPRRELLESAYALETVLQELFFLGGPLLVAVCVAVGSPSLAALVAAGCGSLGALAFAASPVSRAWRGEARAPGDRLGPLRAPGLRTLVGIGLLCGGVFGTLAITVPAFAEAEGARALAGVLLAGNATGSLVGGLWYGSRRWRTPPERRYLVCLAAFAASLLPIVLAGSPPVMFGALLLSGVAIAPTFATAYTLISRLSPPGTATESFAWLSTSIVAGLALGNTLGGALVEGAGVRTAFGAAVALGTVAALAAWARRGTLVPRA